MEAHSAASTDSAIPAGKYDADLDRLFGAGGPLAPAVGTFKPRQAQTEMAKAVAHAIDNQQVLMAEAGTGTGKTFAYLVPALLWGGKTIVSTGTRALQDQLYLRDLPRVRDALGTPVKTALLKGRANYLCKHRLERAKGEPRFANREQIAQFQRIVAWSGRTRMGDMAELDALPEDSPLLPMVTSTAENCLGSECPFWSECFVVQARARAQTADIVVENSRPGVAAKLGVDYATLARINPRLVYASISGFGQTGPWSQRPGFDLIAQAMSGVMSAMGIPGAEPVKSGVSVGDLGAGLFALYAILSAIIFNALIIVALIPLALRGVAYRPMSAAALLRRNLLIYGLGGVIAPFISIKAIDLVLTGIGLT